MRLLPAITGRAYFTPGSYTTLLGVGLRADHTYNISNALPDGGDLTWAVQLNAAVPLVPLVGLRAA